MSISIEMWEILKKYIVKIDQMVKKISKWDLIKFTFVFNDM